jgi:Rps23 Pro-64 3,4-dihydroxylase Tpa1-like proline 4-hydroxylase
MHEKGSIFLSPIAAEEKPFRHFSSDNAFDPERESLVCNWLEKTPEWYIAETDFYQQYEFNLFKINLSPELQFLKSEKTISAITETFKDVFRIAKIELLGIMAHKLTDGQRIAIHNDFINGEETHRMVIHLNNGWSAENGGYLMLFNSSNANDVAKIINPVNNFAFGFEISPRSHHAVSKIYNFSRYTLVYTFKATQ